MKYYLSVAAMFRDEARWMREWVAYHHLLGVEHFYLYDHLSSDQPEVVLADYIASGLVSLTRLEHDLPDFQCLAVQTYNQATTKAKGESRWLALLDVDEYINPQQAPDLPTILRDYEEYGGLVLNWQMFGTSGVAEVPANGLITELLQKRGLRQLGHNIHIKSIVQPERVVRAELHFATYQEPYYAVNTNRQRIDGPFDRSIPVDVLQLNHYFCRDLKFLTEVKIPRRIKIGTSEEIMRRWEAEMNVELDTSIQRFVPALKQLLS
jgi:hypothetical protein